jgi:hypothetical protein
LWILEGKGGLTYTGVQLWQRLRFPARFGNWAFYFILLFFFSFSLVDPFLYMGMVWMG